ncbi:uncharacterized protein N7469_009279 [Penicillium citrinum]|uniref:Major facilitator superfamily (MFS) profile domain-containing protein n=1 Tax=Penicillium citrinum TaxID=5077 RepID=A0A9W9THV0_PENCI|nr:uncharacterized protein N7469_009279 [Penicillium citrinum]KAJ5223039.1 hypothetical protein N7469_009279 [Penicillium citrinum]
MGIYTGCILFIIGAIIQVASYSIAQMTVGRAVVGLGVGSAAMIVPVTLYSRSCTGKISWTYDKSGYLSITTGQLVSYGIGAAFESVSQGWRYMAVVGAVPAIILCCLLPFCPESPRQLVYHNKRDEAAIIISRIFPDANDLQVQQKLQHISIHVETNRNLNTSLWWQIKQLHVVGANFRAMFAACGLMAISQLGGFNSILYYSGTIFAAVGFDKPIAVGTIIAATNWIFTWINLFLVDRVGRRQILLNTLWLMAAAMSCAAICFHWIPISPSLEIISQQTGWAADGVLASMVVFVAFYSIGAGNIAWMSSEFYPIEVRAVGTMLLAMSCWGSNVIVSSTFLTQMENITPSGAFCFYAAISFFGWIGVYFCYPEVKGMTLEDIREVFEHGFGVGFAPEKQKKLKASSQTSDARDMNQV